MHNTSCEMLDQMKHNLESRLPGEISVTSDMQITPHAYGRKPRGTKEPLDEWGEWKSWLETQNSKNEDHGSGPITSWQIDGETMETVMDFILLGSKVTADGDCRHEIKWSLLGRKAMINLDSMFKSRDIRLQSSV